MAFHFGEVLLVPIVFSAGSGTKQRPVLVIHDAADADLLVVPITSHAPLRLPSTARMAKLATVSKATIIRRLGQLTERGLAQAKGVLQQFSGRIS